MLIGRTTGRTTGTYACGSGSDIDIFTNSRARLDHMESGFPNRCWLTWYVKCTWTFSM